MYVPLCKICTLCYFFVWLVKPKTCTTQNSNVITPKCNLHFHQEAIQKCTLSILANNFPLIYYYGHPEVKPITFTTFEKNSVKLHK